MHKEIHTDSVKVCPFLTKTSGFTSGFQEQRDICIQCERPMSVCLCDTYPEEPIPLGFQIIIIQAVSLPSALVLPSYPRNQL